MQFKTKCRSQQPCALVNLDLLCFDLPASRGVYGFSVCVRVCVREKGREKVWRTDCVRACACQRGNNINVTLRCITPCLMIWFAIAVSQALLLLSQCRAISSVVIAKQIGKKKKKERKLRSKWWWHPAFFFSVQMFQHFCSHKKKVENKQLVFPALCSSSFINEIFPSFWINEKNKVGQVQY